MELEVGVDGDSGKGANYSVVSSAGPFSIS